MVKPASLQDPLLIEAEELWDDFAPRRAADTMLENVFVNGRFTGKLYDALGLNVQNSGSNELIINFLRAAVIDRTTMLSMLPDYKYTVPFTPDPDIAMTEQDVLINLHLTLWDFWRMKRTLKGAAFNMSLKNRALWLLFPDFKAKKPALYSLDPSMFYGSPDYMGNYKRCFLMKEECGRKIWSQYPESKDEKFGITSSTDLYRVTELWDEDKRRVWLNNIPAERGNIDHKLGFCPVRYTQDVHIPGSIDNMSNAYHNIAMAENFTDVLLLTSQEMRRRINSIIWAKGAISKDNMDAALEGKEILDLENDGEVGVTNVVDGQLGAQQHLQTLEGLFRTGMNWPALRSGQIGSSIWTAKGINAAQSGVNDDILNTRETMADDLQWLDFHAIQMFRKMWGKSEVPLVTFTDEGQARGQVRIIPKEDIPEDFRHELVTFSLANDVTGKAILLMQLFGQKLLDRRSVLEQMPGFNPNEIMTRLEEDMTRDVQWQAQVMAEQAKIQAAIAPPQGPETADQQNQALEGGSIPQESGQLIQGMVPTPNPRSAGFIGEGAGGGGI